MLYGIPTLMDLPDLDALSRFCAENGFQFVELNMTFPWFQPGVIDPATIRALMRKYGIVYTVHLNDQVNPFEFSPEMRRGCLENARFALELARELEMPRLNMHLLPGTYSSINGVKTYLYGHCIDLYLDHVRRFRDLVDQELRGLKTVFCIENTGGFHSYQRKAIDLMLESPAFGLTFDVGHSYRAGGKDEPFILSHAERLRHFHIHDCDAKANHLSFGEGRIDLVRYLEMARRLDAGVVVEVKESGALLRSREYRIRPRIW